MDESSRKKLLDDYAVNRSADVREQLIIEFAPLVKVVAGRLSMYLGYNVEFEDLCSYGIFGLIDAIDKFDNLKDVKFETYASLRIRGSILDQIRKMDWIPRTIRQKQKKIDAVMHEIEQSKGRAATDDEIAQALGITEDEFSDWQNQMKITGLVSLDEFVESGADVASSPSSQTTTHFLSPEENIDKKELTEKLSEALSELSDKEQQIITFYYYEEMTLKEIAQVLDVSESRISQLHTRALKKMKDKLGPYMNILTHSA